MGYAPRTSEQCSHGNRNSSDRQAIHLLVFLTVAVVDLVVDILFMFSLYVVTRRFLRTAVVAVVCLAAKQFLSCLNQIYLLLAPFSYDE